METWCKSWRRIVSVVFAISCCGPPAAATLTPIGGIRAVPDPRGFGGALPAVANAPDGRSIVIYPGGSDEADIAIRYQLFDPIGRAVTGERVVSISPVVIVDGDGIGDPSRAAAPSFLEPIFYSPPQVAMNETGESLVVWSGAAGGQVDVLARLIGRDGNLSSGEVRVNVERGGTPGHPAVAATAEGWVVTWQTAGFTGIRARRFDRGLTPLSAEIEVSDQGGVQFGPSVAVVAGGGFAVAWTGETPIDGAGEVLVRHFDAAGEAIGASFVANATPEAFQGNPSIGADAKGRLVVAWTGTADEADVFLRYFAANGTPLGGETRVNTTTDQLQVGPKLAVDGAGRVVIAWQQENFHTDGAVNEGLYARAYDKGGNPLTDELRVTSSELSPVFNPVVALDAGGELIYGGTGSDGGVFLQRYTLPCAILPVVGCLAEGRFKVEVNWRNQFNDTSGLGLAIPTAEGSKALTGYFGFDTAENVELIIKVLDFGSSIKVFYSQLTDLDFDIYVTDTTTGKREVYGPTAGNCGAIDQDAFAHAQLRQRLNRKIRKGLFKSGTCVANGTTLCLLDNRFAVTMTWRNPYLPAGSPGSTGTGTPRPLTNLTGQFAFDNPTNIELLVKILDFGAGDILVLYGALSDFEYTLTVADTTNGRVKVFHNAAGNYCGGFDRDAF